MTFNEPRTITLSDGTTRPARPLGWLFAQHHPTPEADQ